MIEEKVHEGLKEWLQNPYWAKYYYEAPSAWCKSYIALDFQYSDTEDGEVAKEMDRVGGMLKLEDWEYLYKHATGPGKAAIAKKIAELKK